LVKAYAQQVGLDGAAFGAHSLRSGFLTSAARRGASVFKMRDVSRHKSMDVLHAYWGRPAARSRAKAVVGAAESDPQRSFVEALSCEHQSYNSLALSGRRPASRRPAW